MNGIFFVRLQMRQYVAQPRPSRAEGNFLCSRSVHLQIFRPSCDHRRRPNAARGVSRNFKPLSKRSHAWSSDNVHRSHSVAERPERHHPGEKRSGAPIRSCAHVCAPALAPPRRSLVEARQSPSRSEAAWSGKRQNGPNTGSYERVMNGATPALNVRKL
jgi:hypothetical protein